MRAEGAKHLASALQVNTVRLDFSTPQHSSAIFMSHRHSQRFNFMGLQSALKGHNIWRVHCKCQTRFLNFPTLLCYLHVTQTLTTLHLESNEIGTEGAKHLASALEANKVTLHFTTSQHSSAISTSHRHSQCFILK